MFIIFFLFVCIEVLQSTVCWLALRTNAMTNSTGSIYVASIITISPWILTQIISQVRTDWPCESLWTSCKLTYLLMLKFMQILEVYMFHQLRRCPSLIFIINKHICNHLLPFFRDMRYQLTEPWLFLGLEVYFHMSGMLSEIFKYFFRWGS